MFNMIISPFSLTKIILPLLQQRFYHLNPIYFSIISFAISQRIYMLPECSENNVPSPSKVRYCLNCSKIIYLVRHPETQIFCPESLERFNMYKRFVENTIMELGEDWRIESGLLAQEIMTEKSLTNDEFCIFNEFMAGFLRKRLGYEGNMALANLGKMVNEEEGQEEFLKYFNKGLGKANNTAQQTDDFSSNLTFKTLSLGFYITASDIWTKTFKKYHQDTIEEKFNSIGLSQERKLRYFGTIEVGLFGVEKWSMREGSEVKEVVESVEDKIGNVLRNGSELLSNAVKLGSIVMNIQQTTIPHPLHQTPTKIRTFSLCRQFYLHIFLIWLIFSIKKSFNSSLFSSTCFVRYCDIIIGSRISPPQIQKPLSEFHSIYKQFKVICDQQWKKLMKDYMVALGDDREVIRVLMKRIGQRVAERFEVEVEAKRTAIK